MSPHGKGPPAGVVHDRWATETMGSIGFGSLGSSSDFTERGA